MNVNRYPRLSKVRIDGGDVVATVTAHLFRETGCQCECSWFSNGVHHVAWFDEDRLEKAYG